MPQAQEKPTLYLLDGSYYVFRSFYAVSHLSNSKGLPTNALFGFTGMLLNLMRDKRPEYLAIAFDPPGKGFRHELYPAYKANRAETPEALLPQFPWFRQIVKALEIPILERPGVEADDMIGSFVRRSEREGIRVVVLTGDKDLCQLVDEDTILVDTLRDKITRIPEVVERFQVGPDRVADVLGLAGDTSDNIPGVPGIGEKTAGKLVAEFGSLEGVLANVDRVSGDKRRQSLIEFAEQARLSKDLATIRTDLPVEVNLERLRLSAPDFREFDRICAELEFHRFPAQVRAIFPESAPADPPVKAEETLVARTVLELGELDEVVRGIETAQAVAIALHATDDDPLRGELVGVALGWGAGQAAYVPCGHVDLMAPTQPSARQVVQRLAPMFASDDVRKVCADMKRAIRILDRHSVLLRGVSCDVSLAASLLDPNRRPPSPRELCIEHLGRHPVALETVAGAGRDARPFAQVSVEGASRFACEEADGIRRLGSALRSRLEGTPLLHVHDDIELPLSRVLARMESTGVRIDVSFLRRLSAELRERMAAIEAQIHAAAGVRFSVNSPKQLGAVLFETLGLPVGRKTKSGPSTDSDVLEELRDRHPLPGLVLDWRQLQKLASTYVDALPQLVNPVTGRVHTSYHQTVASTGRLSSSDPNLQNIPVRTGEGRRIRESFVPEEGWLLLGADYSQIELRVLAHMSGDRVLIESFGAGDDIHRRTAAEIFGVEAASVTREQRAAAKTINFGVIYGMGANRLAAELSVSRAEAADYIRRYFERISSVKPFFDGLVEGARRRGYAETLVGRRRPVPELRSSQERERALGERLAVNAPIQGTAADIIKLAMLRIDARLREAGLRARMLLQVHDELVFEVPPPELEAVRSLVREGMEGAMQLAVPLTVDMATGHNWAELK